jgi:signal peptidase II
MSRSFFIWAAILGLVADRVPKLVVHGLFTCGAIGDGRELRLLGDVVKVTYAKNPHGLFSVDYGPPFIYFVLSLSAAALVAWFGLRARDWRSATAFGLILSGALGNVIDRIGLNYVIDFLLLDLPGTASVLSDRASDIPMAVFNLADVFVFAGAALLLGREVAGRVSRPRAPRRAPGPAALPEPSNPGTPGLY